MPVPEIVPPQSRVTERIPTGPPPLAPAAPPDMATTIAAAVTQGVIEGLKSGKLGWSEALSIIAITSVIAMGIYHEAGNKPYQDAMEALVDVVVEHAECSEDSFQALADDKPPPKCPDRKKPIRAIERSLR